MGVHAYAAHLRSGLRSGVLLRAKFRVSSPAPLKLPRVSVLEEFASYRSIHVLLRLGLCLGLRLVHLCLPSFLKSQC